MVQPFLYGFGMDENEALLETFEPDRFVSLFFVPAYIRGDVAALYGFELELARVATQVAEPMVAQIRYAWWREQLCAVFEGRPVQAPAFQAIAPVIEKHDLPQELFDRLIDGHALDCERFPFADIAQMERHARATAGCVFKIAARILGADARVDVVADHAGVAYGMSRQLNETAHWLRHSRLRLPLNLLSTGGLNEEAMFHEPPDRKRFACAVECVKASMRTHLAFMNNALYPPRFVSILAPAAMARIAGHARFDVFETRQVCAFERVARLAGANLLLRF